MKDGGPAFPGEHKEGYYKEGRSGKLFENISHSGMTVRQWYKGMAMAGYNANPNRNLEHEEFIAKLSARDADAQIAEDEEHAENNSRN